jgi:quercetin dioxygenase-like cupin family protein
MKLTTFEQFQTQALADGATEVLSRDWPAHAVIEEHTHPFAVTALMVRGQLWLTVDGQTTLLQAGDRFKLAHAKPHAERYGPEGATYWVARRSTP